MRIINKFLISTTKFLNLVSISYENKNGKVSHWISAERSGGQNSLVIAATLNDPETLEDKLVIIKEFRPPIGGYEYSFPAGMIDAGESVKDAAKRELKEETGLDIVRFIREPSPAVYNSAGMTSEASHIVYVEAKCMFSSKGLEDSEDILPMLMGVEEIKDLMDKAQSDKNVMIGAKAWLIMERFVTHKTI